MSDGCKDDDNDSNASEEGAVMGALFTCEEYILKSWKFGDYDQHLLSSNQSSTDHDLTGQIVWPAAIMLCWFIHCHRVDIFKDAHVIELGAGAGLAGFFASKFAKSTLITDGNEVRSQIHPKHFFTPHRFTYGQYSTSVFHIYM